MEKTREVREIIGDLYRLTAELERKYPGRHFTPDGHMVGSLGEAVAAERYGLKLFTASAPVHDAETDDGRLVQIKATQGDSIAISSCPEYLIVLQLSKTGEFEEVYNGPGKKAWELRGKEQKTGQCRIALSKLRVIAAEVAPEEKIAESRV